jgi:hypothetical protein
VSTLSEERKLVKVILRCQVKELERQQEAGTIMCALCFIQELKYTVYTVHDVMECTLL